MGELIWAAIFSFISWFIKTFYWSLFNIKNFDAIYVVHGRIHSIPFALISKIFNKKLFIKIGRGGDIFDLNHQLHANISIDYNYTKSISAYLRINNIFNSKQDMWEGYQEIGRNAWFGLSYSF